MPRPSALDLLQSYSFWLFDPGVLGGSFLPSIFDPALAFSSISSPELAPEFYEFKQITSRHRRRYMKSVAPSVITLSRGVRWWDSDFYMWLNSSIRGERGVRRTVYLVHLLRLRSVTVRDASQPGRTQVHPETALNVLSSRIPARAWVLRNCLPGRYKAGSDFDATSSVVSVSELELVPEAIEEVTVGTLSQTVARSYSLGTGISDIAGAF